MVKRNFISEVYKIQPLIINIIFFLEIRELFVEIETPNLPSENGYSNDLSQIFKRISFQTSAK